MKTSSQTRLWKVEAWCLYWAALVVPFADWCTDAPTYEGLLSTFPWGDGRLYILTMFSVLLFIYPSSVTLGEVVHLLCGDVFYLHCLLHLGHWWDKSEVGRPSKPALNPQWHLPLTVPRRYPIFTLAFCLYYVHVCALHVIHRIVFNIMYSSSSLLPFKFLHWWTMSSVYAVSPARSFSLTFYFYLTIKIKKKKYL